jgi:putative ABC transport system permease protein
MNSLRVGIFLALRQIRSSSKWTSGLIILIMTLTFINLIAVSGILVGLPEGASRAIREFYSGDILISSLPENRRIERSEFIISTLEGYPEVEAYSPRYVFAGQIEANYKDVKDLNDERDIVGTSFIGINPTLESKLTGIDSLIIEGLFLEEGNEGNIIIGSDLLDAYLQSPEEEATLGDIDIGERVRVTIANVETELVVQGIIDAKAGQISRNIYILDSELRKITNVALRDYHEIAVKLESGTTPARLKNQLLLNGVGAIAMIETWDEAQGSFIDDIKSTFNILGLVIGFIGLAASSITIFIIIFINAVTRQKYIGILKGVGIRGSAIEISYVIQSMIYALVGTVIGLLITYFILVPFFEANPIDFPFSDGILVAPIDSTVNRVIVLLISTLIAGFIPSYMIIRRNTLDSILGR